MQRIGLFFVVLIFLITAGQNSFAKKIQEPVQSTQGVEITEPEAVEKSKISKEEKNEQKDKKNRSIEYIKLRKKIDKQDRRRTYKQKELEYLENRLEIKKQKLESLKSDEVKGEETE